MVHIHGENWCAIKDLYAPFPVLMAGNVDHLLVHIYMYLFFYDVMCWIKKKIMNILYSYFSLLIKVLTHNIVLTYFSKLLKIRFFTYYILLTIFSKLLK